MGVLKDYRVQFEGRWKFVVGKDELDVVDRIAEQVSRDGEAYVESNRPYSAQPNVFMAVYADRKGWRRAIYLKIEQNSTTPIPTLAQIMAQVTQPQART